jgi:hypothetical protein
MSDKFIYIYIYFDIFFVARLQCQINMKQVFRISEDGMSDKVWYFLEYYNSIDKIGGFKSREGIYMLL